MAEELFDNCYAVNMSLAEAIGRKILPLPIYVTSWYSFNGDIARLQKKAETSGNPYFRRVLLGKIQKAKSMVADMDCGLDTIFARHMKKTSGKYIVFCANTERLQQAVEESVVWFQKVNTNIHSYQVFSQNNQSEQQFKAFRDDVDPTALKLLFSVNMLNEGVHVDGVDGVIMLRATQSANVFYQQLGRALSCSTGKQPVIFDIVNNFETGDAAKQYAEIMEIGRKNGNGAAYDIQFELYDYVQDIRELLSDLRNTFEDSWEVVYEVLREYVEKHQSFPAYTEEYAGYKLGVWCSNQRVLRSTGNLLPERIDKLNQLNFVWDAKDERWNNSFQLAREYKRKHEKLPVRTDTSDEAGSIYQWISNQKQLYKKGKLSKERRMALESLGVSVASKSADTLWEENYTFLCQFLSEYGRFPASSDCKERKEIYSVYRWISKQRKAYKDGTLSQKRMTKLNQIGFVWDKADALWNERFEILKKFVCENGRTPTAREKYGADCIGQWYCKQLRYCQDGSLEEGKWKKLDSLMERRIVKSGKLLPCVRQQELR